MIKKLDETYRRQVLEYLNLEKEVNTFNILDLKKYGFENIYYRVYADIDEKENIKSLVFKCFEYLTFYSYGEFDLQGICNLIRNMEFDEISGKSEEVDLIARELGLLKYRKVNLARLNSDENLYKDKTHDFKIKKINIFNMKKIAKLYEEINEFQNTNLESIRNNLKTGRGYCIEENKKIVSMAKTTAENKNTAMIIGVGTHPKYRNRGLATICISKLCDELLSQNITPCLFYDDEVAGRIYARLGFENIGKWSIYYR